MAIVTKYYSNMTITFGKKMRLVQNYVQYTATVAKVESVASAVEENTDTIKQFELILVVILLFKNRTLICLHLP